MNYGLLFFFSKEDIKNKVYKVVQPKLMDLEFKYNFELYVKNEVISANDKRLALKKVNDEALDYFINTCVCDMHPNIMSKINHAKYCLVHY